MDDAPSPPKPAARPAGPLLTEAAEIALRARREREATALRENLRRRKAQPRPIPRAAADPEPPCR